MGLFNKFKKNAVPPSNEDLGSIAVRLAKAGKISVPKDDNHNVFGERLDHLQNGELPFGWVLQKRDFINPRDSKLFDLSIRANKATSIREEKALIEEFLAFFQVYKRECQERGECYIKYFSDMHEHCNNSRRHDFSFDTPLRERLDYIISNYDELIANENLKNKILSTLPSDVWSIVAENPGILQSELARRFDPIVKGEVSDLLYHWEQDKKIIREKKGRSYALYPNCKLQHR